MMLLQPKEDLDLTEAAVNVDMMGLLQLFTRTDNANGNACVNGD